MATATRTATRRKQTIEDTALQLTAHSWGVREVFAGRAEASAAAKKLVKRLLTVEATYTLWHECAGWHVVLYPNHAAAKVAGEVA